MKWRCECGREYLYRGWLQRHMRPSRHAVATKGDVVMTCEEISVGGRSFFAWVEHVELKPEPIFPKEALVLI